MTLLTLFQEFIKKENLFQRKDILLLAVSGGIDSVVLCELCKQAGYHFMIAHCNFQLRGEESTRDEAFVRQLASNYGVPFVLKYFDTEQYATENKRSIQVAARELRYNWFNEMLSATTDSVPKCLLTAHHADDNIETMLMNFFKGTGISGMRGILPKQGKIIRPLLFAHKKDLVDFAQNNNLQFVEDSSNASDKYTRNYFRHQLVPSIRKVFPQVEDNLAKNLSRFREVEQLYMDIIQQHKKKLLEVKGNEIHIPILKLKKSSPLETILYEMIKEYGFAASQTREIIGLFDSESGKYIRSASYRIIKNRKWLILSPLKTEDAQTQVIDQEDKRLVFQTGVLEIKELPVEHCQLSAAPDIAQLDAATISFPLILRKRTQADYFYPLGMQKKKKLNRFLSDLKLSITEKENTWLLEMNRKIIWIAGRRIDDRFKITGSTKRVLQITFSSHDVK